MTDIPAGNRRYRNPRADTHDQILFFVLFVAGSAAIWTMKLLGFRQWEVTLVPIGLMLFYALVAVATKRYRIREDRVGDNCYYLGFLFTLVSLSHALWVYDPDGSGAADIIANFGIALGTTILGLAFRVLFNQMREDPVEYEREARQSLAEASMALRSQLSDVATEMSSFKRKIVQITEEGVRDVTTSASTSMTQQVERFAAVATDVNEKIQVAFGTFTDHAVRLNEIASKSVEALHTLFERIDKIEASPELLAKKFDPIVQKFDEVASEAQKRNRAQTTDMKRLREAIDAAVAASEALHTSLAGSDRILSGHLTSFGARIEETLSGAARIAETLTRSGDALAAQVDAVTRSGTAIGQALNGHGDAIAEVRAAIEADLAELRAQRSAISAMAAESREAVRQVEGSLVTLSRTMVEQLGER